MGVFRYAGSPELQGLVADLNGLSHQHGELELGNFASLPSYVASVRQVIDTPEAENLGTARLVTLNLITDTEVHQAHPTIRTWDLGAIGAAALKFDPTVFDPDVITYKAADAVPPIYAGTRDVNVGIVPDDAGREVLDNKRRAIINGFDTVANVIYSARDVHDRRPRKPRNHVWPDVDHRLDLVFFSNVSPRDEGYVERQAARIADAEAALEIIDTTGKITVTLGDFDIRPIRPKDRSKRSKSN